MPKLSLRLFLTPSGHSWRFVRSLKGRCRLIEWRLCCCYCKAIKRSRRLAGWGSHAWPAVAVSQHELRQKLANTRIHTWIEIERHYAKAAHKFIWLTCVILKRRVESVSVYWVFNKYSIPKILIFSFNLHHWSKHLSSILNISQL